MGYTEVHRPASEVKGAIWRTDLGRFETLAEVRVSRGSTLAIAAVLLPFAAVIMLAFSILKAPFWLLGRAAERFIK